MNIGVVIGGFLWASVKFLFGAAWCLGSISSPFWGFIICISGATTGILVFTFWGMMINRWISSRFKKGSHFNKRNRYLVKLKNSGGLPMVAFLTPVLLSIPLGCIAASTFEHHRGRIVAYMMAAVLFWGTLVFGAQWLFDLDVASALSNW